MFYVPRWYMIFPYISQKTLKSKQMESHRTDLYSPGHQIFYKHGVRLVEAAEIQLESQGGPATYAVFILPYL